jgi:hypothetical protein
MRRAISHRFGQSHGFKPSSLAGCILWLNESAFSDNGVTATWTDQSGAGNHATKTGTRPTHSGGYVNFAGATFMSGALTIANAVTFLIRMIDTNNTNGTRFAFDAGGNYRVLRFGGSLFLTVTNQMGDSSPSGADVQYTGYWDGNNAHNAVGRKNGTQFQVTPAGSSGASGYHIGSDNGGGSPWIGGIKDFIVYSRQLSPTEYAACEAYQMAL